MRCSWNCSAWRPANAGEDLIIPARAEKGLRLALSAPFSPRLHDHAAYSHSERLKTTIRATIGTGACLSCTATPSAVTRW